MVIFRFIREVFSSTGYFFKDLFIDFRYDWGQKKFRINFFDNIRWEYKMAKNHFAITIMQRIHFDYWLRMIKVYDEDYKYEIAVAHKKYNHGCWIILYRGTDKQEAKKVFSSKLRRISNLTRASTLQDVVSKRTYSWAYNPPVYSWEKKNGKRRKR